MKILGFDLGSNSIGWAIRNTLNDGNQIEKFGVSTFEKGVGNGKTGEFSFAAERTKKRSGRRLYQARKYRLWSTLKILMESNLCPITEDELNQWMLYDKERGYKRKYPVNARLLEQWIQLDFNGDGRPDYISPYQLREELALNQIDISIDENRFKLGRAIYHIAQRRGFKSSRKDAQANDETGEKKDASSELKKDKAFYEHLEKEFGKTRDDFATIGCALAYIERQGQRVRNEWIQYTFRKHYKEEVAIILNKQGIRTSDKLYIQLVESKANRYDGSVFYQRPLRSQKGLVGLCTLEQDFREDPKTGKSIATGKTRCSVSHPAFEEFRALQFINNIQIDKRSLSNELRHEIFNKLFFRVSKQYFKFEEIRELLEKKLNRKLSYKDKSINYPDKTNVSGCPVSARLKDIFGEGWRNINIKNGITRKTNNDREHTKIATYTIEEIWHVLFSFWDEEAVHEFACEKLQMPEIAGKLVTAWNKLPDGYGMLSLNAINKINTFLREGYIYTEAVMLANIPSILGESWNDDNKKLILDNLSGLIEENKYERKIINIVNNLISRYKSLPEDSQFAFKNSDYTLCESDIREIERAIIDVTGEKTWQTLSVAHKQQYKEQVANRYQAFFANPKRDFCTMPRVSDTLSEFLLLYFPHLSDKEIGKLYHPSRIDIYPDAPRNEEDGKFYLQSPQTGAFKNPMAMRTLYQLRKLVNYLIKTNQIDEETRIVVEMARELNDANKRWAIKTYQQRREDENKEFAMAIAELKGANPQLKADPNSNDDIDKVRLWFDQLEKNAIINKGKDEHFWSNITTEVIQKAFSIKDNDIEKYRLWSEQNSICIYTGKPISLAALFTENRIDFEHTLPRSKSFDNSLSNLTVCFSDYNRNIKGNRIPAQLDDYDSILERVGLKRVVSNSGEIEFETVKGNNWANKVEQIKANIDYWRAKSKRATTKDDKDQSIKQRHLWTLELDYWQRKVDSFKTQEITNGFKNSQLVDTQIISKYAMHYLKTVFKRVEVQKGSVTAEFRRIYGLQPQNEKKDRSQHSHHAKDAAVLTLIPLAGERDSILSEAYSTQERTRHQFHTQPYKGFSREHIESISDAILINSVARDTALSKAHKHVVVNGEKHIATGDSIRGALHAETFLGAIRVVKRDENKKPITTKGQYQFEDKLRYVVREQFMYKKDSNSPGFKDLKELESCIVDPDLFVMIKKQIGERSFKDAMTDGIYMLNRKGEKVNRIRHIRIFVRATEPLQIKKQSHTSKKELENLPDMEHKKYFYAANGENYAYALYQGIVKNKIERGFQIYNLFDATSLAGAASEIPFNKKGDMLQLYAILKTGQKVLFYDTHPDELEDNINDMKFISKRLYKITGFEKDGRIKFLFHLESRPNNELSESADFMINELFPKLRLRPSKFNFLIESKDFSINPDGSIALL